NRELTCVVACHTKHCRVAVMLAVQELRRHTETVAIRGRPAADDKRTDRSTWLDGHVGRLRAMRRQAAERVDHSYVPGHTVVQDSQAHESGCRPERVVLRPRVISSEHE